MLLSQSSLCGDLNRRDEAKRAMMMEEHEGKGRGMRRSRKRRWGTEEGWDEQEEEDEVGSIWVESYC